MHRYVSWVAFIERRHRAILVGSLVVALAAASSLAALRLDFDVLGMLPTGAPAFDNFKSFVADFGELDELVVLATSHDAAALQAFADAFAARLKTLDTVRHLQGKIDVDQIQQGILGRYVYNYVPAPEYVRLQERLTPAGVDAQVAADRAILQAPLDLSGAQWIRRDPLGITRLAAHSLDAAFDDATLNVKGGYLSTPDGSALLILVQPTQNAFDIAFNTRFMQQVRDAERAARAETPDASNVRVGYTGSYAFALEDAATLKWDIARYTVLALIGVLAVFSIGYRSLRILPFVTYPLLVSTVLTFAASLLCYAQLNAVSISFAAILYGLSIDSGIHYYTRLLQESRHHDLKTAVTRTLAALGGANVVASSTTAAVFCVIGFSRLSGVSQLGFLTAIGMLINIVEFFMLYPALSFWTQRASLAHAQMGTPRLGRWAAASATRARGVVLGVAVMGVALLIPASGVGFDVDLNRLRPGESPASRVQDEIAARFATGAPAGAILVRATELEAALEASEDVAAQLAVYRKAGLVRGVRGITTLLPSVRTQRQRLGLFNQLPRAQILDDLRQGLARHGFVPRQFEDFFTEFVAPHDAIVRLGDPVLQPFALLLGRYVRGHRRGYTVATYIEPAAGVSLGTVADRLHHDLKGIQFIVAGRSLLEEALGDLLRRELVVFCVASFVVNFFLILGNFPHAGTALAILAPEALVTVALFAAMHWTGVGIDPVNLIVVPLMLGIGVDNCVYIAERHQRGEPARHALRHGGRAVVISAFTTMAGFGFLGLSRYPALARMGLLTAASLLLCLIAAITVLPALLVLLAPQTGARQETGNHG